MLRLMLFYWSADKRDARTAILSPAICSPESNLQTEIQHEMVHSHLHVWVLG